MSNRVRLVMSWPPGTIAKGIRAIVLAVLGAGAVGGAGWCAQSAGSGPPERTPSNVSFRPSTTTRSASEPPAPGPAPVPLLPKQSAGPAR